MRKLNRAFLGFEVPAGRTEVDLRYHPVSFDLGLTLAAAGLVVLMVGARRIA